MANRRSDDTATGTTEQDLWTEPTKRLRCHSRRDDEVLSM
jgi:hypothetical protein